MSNIETDSGSGLRPSGTVICMASAKGGSGKTVLTATFGAFLAAIGKRVLAIDTDASTNGLTLMFLKETLKRAEVAISNGHGPEGIYEGTKDFGFEPVVVPTNIGMDLLPATYAFGNTELVPIPLFEQNLRNVLRYARTRYDFIFLDAQAGADSIAHVAMNRANSDQ